MGGLVERREMECEMEIALFITVHVFVFSLFVFGNVGVNT